jgi:peroxiredoxin Q/BCP
MAKLEIGDAAPAFTLADTDGQPVSLQQFAGSRVVLYFYPKDDTPGCTKEACQFTEELPHFTEQGAVVIGVSPDSSASHQKFRSKYDLGIVLLSDPTKQTMEAYGAFGEKTMYGKKVTGVIRSTFIIDADGKIAKTWYSVKADGHATKVLASLQG